MEAIHGSKSAVSPQTPVRSRRRRAPEACSFCRRRKVRTDRHVYFPGANMVEAITDQMQQ